MSSITVELLACLDFLDQFYSSIKEGRLEQSEVEWNFMLMTESVRHTVVHWSDETVSQLRVVNVNLHVLLEILRWYFNKNNKNNDVVILCHNITMSFLRPRGTEQSVYLYVKWWMEVVRAHISICFSPGHVNDKIWLIFSENWGAKRSLRNMHSDHWFSSLNICILTHISLRHQNGSIAKTINVSAMVSTKRKCC